MSTGVLCCNNCHPELLDRTRPGVTPRKKALISKSAASKGEPDPHTQARLEEWREEVFNESFANSLLSRSSVLDDDLIVLLSCYGRLSYSAVHDLLASQWVWWPVHGRRLSELMESLAEREEHSLPATPKRRRKKRKRATSSEPSEEWNVRFQEPEVCIPSTPAVGTSDPIQYTFSAVEFPDGVCTPGPRKPASQKRPAAEVPPAPKKPRMALADDHFLQYTPTIPSNGRRRSPARPTPRPRPLPKSNRALVEIDAPWTPRYPIDWTTPASPWPAPSGGPSRLQETAPDPCADPSSGASPSSLVQGSSTPSSLVRPTAQLETASSAQPPTAQHHLSQPCPSTTRTYAHIMGT